MRLYNLVKNSEHHFSHNDINMAFAYAIAEKLNLMSQFAWNPSAIIKEHVEGNVVKGRYGYHLVEMSIPFSSIEGEASTEVA